MAQQGRVQAPQFKNNLKLQPAARPVDTFEAPAVAPQDRNAARLVDALSGFSSQIGALAPVLGAQAGAGRKEANQAALAERENFFMKASPEEKRAYIVNKHGLDQDDKIQAAAIGRMDGGQYAEMVQTELQQEMQTFDWANGDPEAYAKQFLQKRLQESGRMNEPTFVTAYSQAGQNYALNVVNQREKILAEKRSDDATRAASYYAKSTFVDGIKAGEAPDQVAKKFLSTEPGMGPKGPLMLDDNAAAKIQLDELERQASNPQSVDAVMAAIAMQRPSKGGSRASFRDDPLTTDRATQIFNIAAATKQSGLNAQQKDTLLSQNVKLLEDGTGLLGARDLTQTKLAVNGSTSEETYTVEQQKNDAVRVFLQKDDQRAKELGETPVQTLTRRTLTLAAAGIENPDVKIAAEGLSQAASPETLQNPEAKQKVIQRIDLVRNIQGTNKNIAATYLKGQDKDFYDGFISAREVLGWDDDRALSFAYQVTNPPPGALRRVMAERDTIHSEVRGLRDSGWIYSSSMSNSGAAEDKLIDTAEMYAKAGLDGKTAVKAAKAALEQSSVHYNGTLIDVGSNPARAEMPADFKGAVDAQVDAFLANSPIKGIDRDNVTIQQFGDRDGRFYLIDKETHQPLTDDEGMMHVFTLGNLRAWDNENRKAQVKERETYNVFEQSVKAKGLSLVTDKTGKDVWIDKSRTIWENAAPEGQAPSWKNTGKRVRAPAIVTDPRGLFQGGFVLQRPEKANQKIKSAVGFFTRLSLEPLSAERLANPSDPNSEFLNNSMRNSIGNLKDTINQSGIIKVGKEAEDAINERNRGR